MKTFTIITDAKGELVAAHEGGRGQDAGLVAGSGQKLHTVQLPDDVTSGMEPERFVAAVRTHLPRN